VAVHRLDAAPTASRCARVAVPAWTAASTRAGGDPPAESRPGAALSERKPSRTAARAAAKPSGVRGWWRD
jgi:hypothetical protein